MRSIVIPVKNEEEAVEGTLASFIKENGELVKNTEIIVIDDSEDESFRIEQDFEKKTDDLHVFKQRRPERGKGGALIEGVERARGDVIALVDSDIRTFSIDWIDKLCEPIEEGKAEITKGSYDYEGEDFVTQLIVEPLMGSLFPEVDFERPIEGEIAFSRDAIESLEILPGFQEMSGLVIDIAVRDFNVEEVYLGKKIHGERKGEALKKLADEVHEAILKKGLEYSRF